MKIRKHGNQNLEMRKEMVETKIILPNSAKRFPDGANYRIEVSGMESPGILEAVINEAKRLGIPIHRAISTVKGSYYWTDNDLKELAKIAAENKVEAIICPHKLCGAVFEDINKIFTSLNFEDSKSVEDYIKEIKRCANLGFKGFLVWNKSLLPVLNAMRKTRVIPPDTIFKVSTFANNMNIYDFDDAENKGANTINTANGLTLENLSEIRMVINATIDIHITFWQLALEKNEKGRLELIAKPYDRIVDAPELARICSPCYFKFEAGTPGIGVYDLSGPNWTEKDLAEHKRKDVRTAAEIVKTIKEKYPHLILSDWGPADLRVPIVSK